MKYQALRPQFLSVGGWCWGGWWWGGWWWLGLLDYFSNQIQILKNCHFGVKKNHYPPRWICMTHIWFPTEFHRGIIIFQGVLTKLNFLTKFPHLEKNC